MLAYLLVLAVAISPAMEKIENGVKYYVETNFSHDNVVYQYDFRRVNLSLFPSDFDSVVVLRIGKDSPVGNTVFTLGVYKYDKLLKAIPVSIGVSVLVDALVTTVPINSGQKFHDLDITRRIISDNGQLPLTDSLKLAGKQARTYISPGSVIFPSMLENVPVIESGNRVNIVYETETIKVTTDGLARQKGGIGDMIRVVNLSSRKVIRAEVVDSNTVALR